MDTDKIVHILRNPWGRSAGDLRAAQLLAAVDILPALKDGDSRSYRDG